MKSSPVNIDFKRMEVAFRSHVRLKAKEAGLVLYILKRSVNINACPLRPGWTKWQLFVLAGPSNSLRIQQLLRQA